MTPENKAQVVAAAPAAAPGVPAAWQDPNCPRHVISAEDKRDFMDDKLNGFVPQTIASRCTRPLYAAPTGGEAEQLQTELTDERVLQVWDAHVGEPTAALPFTDADKLAFARAIEREVLSHLAAPKSVRTSGEALGTVPSAEEPEIGDTVRHRPSGEEWLVAYVRDGKLAACGWPDEIVPASDCVLVSRMPLQKKLDLLRDLSRSTGHRADYARALLRSACLTYKAQPTATGAASPEVLPASPDVQDQPTAPTSTDGGNQQ